MQCFDSALLVFIYIYTRNQNPFINKVEVLCLQQWFPTGGSRCQAKFLTCEISDFTPSAHAHSNTICIKYTEKTDD